MSDDTPIDPFGSIVLTKKSSDDASFRRSDEEEQR
jgi:hypothetical protein